MDEGKKFWVPADVRKDVFSNQVSMTTLLNLLRAGKIPSIRLGKRWFIPDTWVQEQLSVGQSGVQ